MTSGLWIGAVVVLLGCYVTWTAGRLDRMHARVDAAWAALDAQLVRRAAAARAVVLLLPDGPESARLAAASSAALGAGVQGRDAVENDLSRALRAAAPLLPVPSAAPDVLHELHTAASRVALARSFHNSAVNDTRALRRRRLPRVLRLAGRRELPHGFDIDDTALSPAA